MPPVNDDFADAIELVGSSGSTTGSNVGATSEVDDPTPYYGDGTNGVWWKWVAPTDDDYVFSLSGSDFDTVLEVYTGPDLAGLTIYDANDDFDGLQSVLTLYSLTIGETYYLRVHGYSSADEGSIDLAWEVAIPPPPPSPTIDDFHTMTGVTVAGGSPGSAPMYPHGGRPGVHVSIGGSGLDTVTQVVFGDRVSPSIFYQDSGTVRCVVPTDCPVGPIIVTSPYGTASTAGLAPYGNFYGLVPGDWTHAPDDHFTDVAAGKYAFLDDFDSLSYGTGSTWAAAREGTELVGDGGGADAAQSEAGHWQSLSGLGEYDYYQCNQVWLTSFDPGATFVRADPPTGLAFMEFYEWKDIVDNSVSYDYDADLDFDGWPYLESFNFTADAACSSSFPRDDIFYTGATAPSSGDIYLYTPPDFTPIGGLPNSPQFLPGSELATRTPASTVGTTATWDVDFTADAVTAMAGSGGSWVLLAATAAQVDDDAPTPPTPVPFAGAYPNGYATRPTTTTLAGSTYVVHTQTVGYQSSPYRILRVGRTVSSRKPNLRQFPRDDRQRPGKKHSRSVQASARQGWSGTYR